MSPPLDSMGASWNSITTRCKHPIIMILWCTYGVKEPYSQTHLINLGIESTLLTASCLALMAP